MITMPDVESVQFVNLGDRKEVDKAMRDGHLRGSDSPRGFLCTLCGCIVANTTYHVRYHAGQYALFQWAAKDMEQ